MMIWEQVDTTRVATGATITRYSWMLGRGYNTRTEMERWGWKWIAGSRGCRGVFVTNDPCAVEWARQVLRLAAPQSNGSHARAGASMFDAADERAAAARALRAAYAAQGLDADAEIEGIDTMTAEQLRDEVTYLADYQG